MLEECERVIYEAADLSYYLRVIEEPAKPMFAGFFSSLMSYSIKQTFYRRSEY